MRVWPLLIGIVLPLGLGAPPALALHEFELWRGPWGRVDAAGPTLNPADGSVWICAGDSVYHYDTNMALLSTTELWWPHCPCVDPNDGSCWVEDWGAIDWSGGMNWPLDRQVTLYHIAADGTVKQTIPGFGDHPVGDTPTPSTLSTQCGPDGSLWMADALPDQTPDLVQRLLRISSDGQIAAEVDNFNGSIRIVLAPHQPR